MNLYHISLLASLAGVALQNDAFTTRVKRHASVIFQKISTQSTIHFDFLGQEYVVDLEPNHAAFHQTFKVFTQDGPQYIPREEYIGTVREPKLGKGVFTQLEDNLYIGVIYFDNDTLHLEPAYPHGLSDEVGSIVGYFGSDVVSNPELLFHSRPLLPHVNTHQRYSRAADANSINEKRNRCTLKLVADYSFYSTFGRNNTGIVTKFLVNIIARVNEIYTPINWDTGREDGISGRGRFQNMGFSIKEIKVLDRPDESNSHYNSYSKKWGCDELLLNFAFAEGSRDFCLVHLVTARTFKEISTLGSSYPSYRTWDDTAGGICSKRESFEGKMAYINVLFTTCFVNLDNSTYPLITKEIEIVVAHEYGHSWGADHDPIIGSSDPDVEDCNPNDKSGGKYLMSKHAQTGFEDNNVLFSPCSFKAIREVLINKWDACFEEEITSFCGNGIVEEGEECDQGVETSGEGVNCCDQDCRLHIGAQCSPSNHICCTSTCQFHNSSHICLPGDSLLCKADAVCNGFTGECPPAPPVKDGQDCLEDGECSNGICLPFCERKSIGRKSCICEDLDLSCRKCCRDQNGTCSPVAEFKYLRDGVKCSTGICRDKKCVNEVIDQVRNYLLMPLKSKGGMMLFLRTHVVGFTVVFISMIFGSIYWIVSLTEKHLSAYHKDDLQITLRQIHITEDDQIRDQF